MAHSSDLYTSTHEHPKQDVALPLEFVGAGRTAPRTGPQIANHPR